MSPARPPSCTLSYRANQAAPLISNGVPIEISFFWPHFARSRSATTDQCPDQSSCIAEQHVTKQKFKFRAKVAHARTPPPLPLDGHSAPCTPAHNPSRLDTWPPSPHMACRRPPLPFVCNGSLQARQVYYIELADRLIAVFDLVPMCRCV